MFNSGTKMQYEGAKATIVSSGSDSGKMQSRRTGVVVASSESGFGKMQSGRAGVVVSSSGPSGSGFGKMQYGRAGVVVASSGPSGSGFGKMQSGRAGVVTSSGSGFGKMQSGRAGVVVASSGSGLGKMQSGRTGVVVASSGPDRKGSNLGSTKPTGAKSRSSAAADITLASAMSAIMVKPNIISSNFVCERRKDLLQPKYKNTLPDPPCGAKSLPLDFDKDRFSAPLDDLHPSFYEQMVDWDVGVEIDLVDPWRFPPDNNDQILPRIELDPADAALLVDSIEVKEGRRSLVHKQRVAWLRRPEYISNEQARFQSQARDKIESKVGYSMCKARKDGKDHLKVHDRKSRIQAIEKTFDDSIKPITKHFCKPDVVAVEVLPIFPDFELWKHDFAQVTFDVDPAPGCRDEEMAAAIIRGVRNEAGEDCAGYFLPDKKPGIQQRTNSESDDTDGINSSQNKEEVYSMARQFNWNLNRKPSSVNENFFVVRDTGVFYYQMQMNVSLARLRRRVASSGEKIPTKLYVKNTGFTQADYVQQAEREKMLQHPVTLEDEVQVKYEAGKNGPSSDSITP